MDTIDVIIIGGSYAGLSAAMALGRSLRKVLIIDNGMPCNAQTPHSHNFITQDAVAPSKIAQIAREQVLLYPNVKFKTNKVTSVERHKDNSFLVYAENGEVFSSKKLLFATGLNDIMPNIKGFADCWGISILHCPYCHGYEVHGKDLGILANGDSAFELARLISNWTSKLTVFTNGPSTLNHEQTKKLKENKISIIENKIDRIEHLNGYITDLVFTDGSTTSPTAIFSRVPFIQKCSIPETLGCELTENGHIQVDNFQRTSIKGVFAAGDNSSPFRAVSIATAAGTTAGAFLNHELIEETF